MLNWLVENSSVFKFQHNAHREFHMSVEQHLSHRARIGNAPMFLDEADRARCSTGDAMWELQVILPDATAFDIAGSSLHVCIRTAQTMMADRLLPEAA